MSAPVELAFFADTSDEAIASVIRAVATSGATIRVRFIDLTAVAS